MGNIGLGRPLSIANWPCSVRSRRSAQHIAFVGRRASRCIAVTGFNPSQPSVALNSRLRGVCLASQNSSKWWLICTQIVVDLTAIVKFVGGDNRLVRSVCSDKRIGRMATQRRGRPRLVARQQKLLLACEGLKTDPSSAGPVIRITRYVFRKVPLTACKIRGNFDG